MPRPRRPVSPVPEGPAEEDQLQTWTGVKDGGGEEGEARKPELFLEPAKSGREERWRRRREIFFFFFFMRVGDEGVGERGERRNSVGERRDVQDFK